MILVVILVVAWLVILGPSVLRRRSAHGDGVSSISHFHRQLQVLEHSGGQPIVVPAYRLQSVDGGRSASSSRYPDVASVPVLSVVGADQLPRPALAFLGGDPAETRSTAPAGGMPSSGRVPAPDATVPSLRDPVEVYRPLDPEQRRLARRRRRDTLMILVLVTVLSLLVGCIPEVRMAWVITGFAGVALAAYVAMLVHLRSMADERERKLHYLRPESGVAGGYGYGYGYGEDIEDVGYPDPASPELVAAYEASRYDHPARQAVAR